MAVISFMALSFSKGRRRDRIVCLNDRIAGFRPGFHRGDGRNDEEWSSFCAGANRSASLPQRAGFMMSTANFMERLA
jgi:hypothetical protein